MDIPISHRGKALGAFGNLTVSGNAQVQQLTNFGTLTTAVTVSF